MIDTLKNSFISEPIAGLKLESSWKDAACSLKITNTKSEAQVLDDIVLFKLKMPFPEKTPFYGEAYNKLSQYKGSVNTFKNVTNYSDAGHYKLIQKEGFFTVYNFAHFYLSHDESYLFGFASCHRFSGEIRFNHQNIEIALKGEGVSIEAGESVDLETFVCLEGEREAVLEQFGSYISSQHARLNYPEAPTGWCSWYCYGPDVTDDDVFDNLQTIKKEMPELKFIQIDDGYQNKMGDWLVPHPNFPGGVKELCLKIKDEGFEPAIWVAPFIAEKDSDLFKKHPDWFVSDDRGEPLSSGDVSFGGWRFGPWYMLDGTHPEARAYLQHVFSTIRNEWKCKYFKLDANMWGALPFGHRYEKNRTCIEAYRMGMQAILDVIGEDGFLLGCNAPMWPSIGMVHGMRTTGDIARKWDIMKVLAEECFHRNWQNKHLWFNDPDCIVLENLDNTVVGPDGVPIKTSTDISEDEFSFHAAHMVASGGMMLSSDKTMELSQENISKIKKMVQYTGKAARFDSSAFEVGRIEHTEGLILCLFNWGEFKNEYRIQIQHNSNIYDFWTDELLAEGVVQTPTLMLPAHSGRVLFCKKTV